MNIAASHRSHFPIPTSVAAPVLKTPHPITFTPLPQTLTHHFTAPPPNLPPPYPQLPLTSFPESSLLPSTASEVGDEGRGSCDGDVRNNCVVVVRKPEFGCFVVFFPTGENWERVGFVKMSVEGSRLKAQKGTQVRSMNSLQTLIFDDVAGVRILSVKQKLGSQRIMKLLVNPFDGDSSIGYLMACTVYGVHWYSIRFDNNENPSLDFIACKRFKSCGIVDACWSPHLPEESLVLLENGKLFLFDLDNCSNTEVFRPKFSGKGLDVPWENQDNLCKGGWLGCEYSWHPRIFVICHSSAVFLVDFRNEEYDVTCLLEIDTSALCTPTRNDRFVAFSRAGSDYFQFVVASEYRVILFDVRKEMTPLLQWTHDIPKPSYINVYSLADLNSSPKDDDDNLLASESGNCILMGSFWECQFNLFSYGSDTTETASVISKFDKALCAWDIPFELSLSGRECNCGSCLLREEFWKESLPAWIDWRQKKEIVLGFAILDKDIDDQLSEQGGFTLIRLMSSGKIESQRYIPTQDLEKNRVEKEPCQVEICSNQDSLLFAESELEYTFQKRFQYFNLDYICAYMRDDLDKALFEKVKEPRKVPCKRDYISSVDFHQSVCEKLKACGLHKSSFALSDVLTRIRLLSSIHEVTLSKMWTRFPADLLQLTFSYYSQLLEVLLNNRKMSLEFLDVPTQPQIPPFIFREPSHRGSKWSKKIRPSTAFVGPVLPTPVLLTIHELRTEEASEFSANSEISDQCRKVIAAAKIATSGSNFGNEDAVSLADDRDPNFEATESMDLISFHESAPKMYGSSTEAMMENSFCYDEKFTTFLCKRTEKDHPEIRGEMDGPEMFDSLSPIVLKFGCTTKVGNNWKQLGMLKKRFSGFLGNYDPYKQYLTKSNWHKQQR